MDDFIGAAKVSNVHEGNNPGTIVFDYIDSAASTDWDDPQSVKRVVPFAISAANGFYRMVHDYYDSYSEDFISFYSPESIIAIAGLTCEIYLKCIMYHFTPETANNPVSHSRRGKPLRKEHNLELLYNNLPLDTFVYPNTEDGHFNQNLRDIAEVFTTFRYSFELTGYEIPYKFLMSFMDSLHDYCENLDVSSPQMIRFSGTR